jgi:hypothetical protein
MPREDSFAYANQEFTLHEIAVIATNDLQNPDCKSFYNTAIQTNY